MMKTVNIVILLACLVLAGSASALTFNFDGMGDDPNFPDPNTWADGSNWVVTDDIGEGAWTTRGILPGEFDKAIIRNGAEAIVTSAQTVKELWPGTWSQSGTVTVNSDGYLHFKNQGTTANIDGTCTIGTDAGITGVLNVNGGTVVIDKFLRLNNSAGSTAIVNMYSGTLQAGYGHGGAGNAGGLVLLNGSSYINMYGGTLDVSFVQFWGTPAPFEIHFYSTDGKIIDDNEWQVGTFNDMITAGTLTAEPGLKVTVAVVNGNVEIFAEVDCPDWPEFPAADINQDCSVDIDDLMILSAHWLENGAL